MQDIFKNENVKVERTVGKKINQVDDITGAVPQSLHK
jgi:hypothetical protein